MKNQLYILRIPSCPPDRKWLVCDISQLLNLRSILLTQTQGNIWFVLRIYLRNIWNFWTGYTSITCSKISIPVQKFKLFLIIKFLQQNLMISLFYSWLFHVTIWICCWRMNMLVTSQYQPRLSSITKFFSRQIMIRQSDCRIQIKLNYFSLFDTGRWTWGGWGRHVYTSWFWGKISWDWVCWPGRTLSVRFIIIDELVQGDSRHFQQYFCYILAVS